MRDLRDPAKLGEAYLHARGKGLDIDLSVNLPARPYTDDGVMSADPANHHSKTPQNIGDLDDGGTS